MVKDAEGVQCNSRGGRLRICVTNEQNFGSKENRLIRLRRRGPEFGYAKSLVPPAIMREVWL
jgi:hypothetical protein